METTDQRVLADLGDRLAQHRLNRNLTQDQLAREAGVSKRTIVRLENGQSSQATNLVRVLRALGLLGDLDALVPAPLASPIEALAAKGRNRAVPRPPARSPSPVRNGPGVTISQRAGVNREHCRRGSDVGTADRRGFHRRSQRPSARLASQTIGQHEQTIHGKPVSLPRPGTLHIDRARS